MSSSSTGGMDYAVIDLIIKALGLGLGAYYVHLQHRLSLVRSSKEMLRGHLYKKRAESVEALATGLSDVQEMRLDLLTHFPKGADAASAASESGDGRIREMQAVLTTLRKTLATGRLYLPTRIPERVENMLGQLRIGREATRLGIECGGRGAHDAGDNFAAAFDKALIDTPEIIKELEAELKRLIKEVEA